MLHKFNTKTNQLIVFVFFFFFIFNATTLFAQNKMYTIVLDAGHGGHDPGKSVKNKKYYEKDIALKITLEVGKILEQRKDVKVIYTRKKDVFVNLYERGNIANKVDADLFISIHCNAHNTQASGTETWALGLHASRQNLEVAKKENEVILLEDNYEENYKGFDPNSPESFIGIKLMQEEYMDQSLALANIVQDNMVKEVKRKNRGVKQAAFIVLHQTYMPSILIETGFITNTNEGAYLNSTKGQNKYAISIANGISEYIKQVNYNSVTSENIIDVIETPEDVIVQDRIVQDVIFKVQIASGRRKLETKSYNFKGLKGIERVKIGKSYKYYFGRTSNLDDAKEFERQARKKGYSSAYIVGFRDGQKISVKEALTTQHPSKDLIVPTKIKQDVVFKVQIAFGARKLETKSYNFKGLKEVERVRTRRSYTYYFGRTSNFDEVVIFKRQARENGYSTAFVVAFKDGKKVSVSEALKTLQ